MKVLQIKLSCLRIIPLLLVASGIGLLSSCSDSKGNDGEVESIKASNPMANKKFKGFKVNIEKNTLDNKNFRKVLYTSTYSQLVVMSLMPNEEIGEETHPKTDQFFRFEGGSGKCIIDGTEYMVKDGDAIIIPAGAKHNIMNTDASKELKMYTIYSPPTHKDGIVRKTKKDAQINIEKYDGVTSEGK